MRRILLGAVAALALTLPATAQSNPPAAGGNGGAKMPPPMVQGGSAGSTNDGAKVQGSANPGAANGAGTQSQATPGEDLNKSASPQPGAAAGQNPKGDQQKADASQNAGKNQGQGGKGRDINITAGNRTVIQKNITKTRVNIPAGVKIGIGVRLPTTIAYLPVPAAIIAELPMLAPYEYIVVDDQIVFVDPATYEIVYVMAAA